MEEIKAPFTDEQVKSLNEFQKKGRFHPFTCCSPSNIKECKRRNNEGDTWEEKEGMLIATKDGWVCPCGKYKQDWAHKFMTENQNR